MSKIELLNIDCMLYMKGLPDKAFDLAIVDPPYGIKDDGRNHLGRIFNKDGKAILKRDKRNGSVIKVAPQKYKTSSKYDDNRPDQNYFDQLFRVSDKVIIWGENYLKFNQKNFYTGRIVWDKVNGDCDQSDCETAWTNCHKSIRLFRYKWCGMLQGKSINEGHINQGNRLLCEERIHPNHKPINLYKWLLNKYAKPVCNHKHTEEYKSLCTDCNKPFRILDTHLGSGSSAIAAHSMGFDFVGCELDKDYYDAACKRFKEQTMQQKLFI